VKQDIGLVVDWETSGIRDQEVPWLNYLEGPQGIEIGAILVYLPTFEPIAEFVSRVCFLGIANGVSWGGPRYERLTWSTEAERIHGMTPAGLADEASPLLVAEKFVKFIKKNARIDDPQKRPIMLCGHNPSGDAYYTRQLLYLGGVERKVRFHHRMMDSFTLGYLLLGAKSSNELFEKTSGTKRGIHSALEDARLTLQAFRNIYQLCRGMKAHDD
jgi:hypothetical protein